MKPSNKILIAFFGVILAYTLMAFAEIRFSGTSVEFHEDNSITESVPFENLKYLVIKEDPGKKFTIIPSHNPRIELISFSGNILSNITYEFNGDTLFLQEFDLGEIEERFHIKVFIPIIGFEGLNTTDAAVQLSEIKQASLSIVQSGGNITLREGNEFFKLNIIAMDGASINIFDSDIDTIAVDLNDSYINIQSEVNQVKGTLANETVLYSNGVSDIQLKKDKGSSIVIN